MSNYYFGVVEDRQDPLKIGRCKVRIAGLHSDNIASLPTEDLPWAVPLQPVYSAAISGLGHAPIGPVEGTWVMITFADSYKQLPIIMGTLAGAPEKEDDSKSKGAVEKAGTDDIANYDETEIFPSERTIETAPDPKEKYLGTLTLEQYETLLDALRSAESGDDYAFYDRETNTAGAYALDIINLENVGYIKKGTWLKYEDTSVVGGFIPLTDVFSTGIGEKLFSNLTLSELDIKKRDYSVNDSDHYVVSLGGTPEKFNVHKNKVVIFANLSASELSNKIESGEVDDSIHILVDKNKTIDSVWVGKNNIVNVENLLSDDVTQEDIINTLMQDNYRSLKSMGLVNDSDIPPEKLAAILCVAYGVGVSNVKRFLAGEYVENEVGKKYDAENYFHFGYIAISESGTQETPTQSNIGKPAVDKGMPRTYTNADYDVAGSPNVSTDSGVPAKPFTDPNKKYPIEKLKEEAESNRLARHYKIEETIVADKDAALVKAVAIPGGKTWDQPQTPYNAKYPFNHVYATESGHLLEFDDTPECERINLHHKTGTFLEIDSNGTQVNVIKGHNCVITEKDGIIHIKGNGHLNIAGVFTLKTSSAILDISGDFNVKTGGNINLDSGGDINLKAGGKLNVDAGGAIGLKSGAKVDIKGGGNVSLDGAKINLNGGAASPGSASPAKMFEGEFAALPIKSREEESAMENEDDPDNARKLALDAEKKPPVKESTVTPASTSQVIASEGSKDFIKPLSMATQLTTNFTISKLSPKGFPFSGQHNLTSDELAYNLKMLAINVAEPLFAKYKRDGIKINSGTRLAGDRTSKSKGISQHELCQAIDIGFSNIRGKPNDRKEYHRIAGEIQTFVPFDQLLLEYNHMGHVWIHISYVHGKKIRTDGTRVLTFNNDKRIGSGLILLDQVG